jgi:outer membrane immunogenic protein
VKQALGAAFGAAILGFASAAAAADLPVQASPPIERIVPAWNINWSGVYGGFNAGYGFTKAVDIPGATSGNHSNIDGALAGGQFGGQWQSGSIVVGAEGDFQGAWQQRAITGTAAGVDFTADQRLRWFGTARLRAGVAFERSLLYVTGGGAYVNLRVTGSALGMPVNDQVSHGAWTAGGGWEFMLAERWSAKLEYLYIDTGKVTLSPFGMPITGRVKENVARAGFNYHY